MAHRTVFARKAVTFNGKRYRIEVKADGLHVREHRSRTRSLIPFENLIELSQNKCIADIMTTPITHKRWQSPEEIEQAIDEARAKATKLSQEADAKEQEANVHKVAGRAWAAEDALKEADRLRASAARLLEGRCTRLKASLAEIQTPLLPCCDNGDKSVQA